MLKNSSKNFYIDPDPEAEDFQTVMASFLSGDFL